MSAYGLPERICIDGMDFAVNTDFRVWIEIGEVIAGNSDIFEKTARVLTLCYKDKVPQTLKKAIDGVIRFYACGKDTEKRSGKTVMPIVDFSEDSGLIGAAFYHDYGINLWREKMHWWQFRELFAALSEDNKIVKVMGYRSISIGDIHDAEQKKFYRKMKGLYRLPDKRSEEEKEREIAAELCDIFEEV